MGNAFVIGDLEQGLKASLSQRGTWYVKIRFPSGKGDPFLGAGARARAQVAGQRRTLA